MSSQYCKLFVGGLNVNTDSNDLRKHFEQYGKLTDCTVIVNKQLQRSRCFGFVTFTTLEEADTAVKAGLHTIDGHIVEVKQAIVREDANKPEALKNMKKVFVGGLKDDIEEEHLMNHFRPYGDIEKAVVISDKDTGKKRGFGFIFFVEHDAAKKVIAEKFHNINGHTVEVKKAMTKYWMQDTSRDSIAMGSQAGRGMRVNLNGNSTKDYGANYHYGNTNGNYRNGGDYNFGSSYRGYPGYVGGYGDQESGYGGRNGYEFGSGYGQHTSGYTSFGPQGSSAPYSRGGGVGYPLEGYGSSDEKWILHGKSSTHYSPHYF
ncbi:heterogeneous nuclear ribonucleoprotein A0-like [Solea solea]|uniref:heterogeneous nuclear ribonucleoprotein A0-like n=1 Tax=Solea solea TaxID=90069 RepID=UPI002729B7B2|nr:heterogeneous nuclear ribonucleoprotein A0-like [Solea solea]